MVDFSLSEEQLGYVKWAREFAQTHVRPASAKLDRLDDPQDRFPWEILERAHEAGVLQFGLPEAFGGSPVDEVTFCLVMEELGAADVGVAAVVAQYWNATQLIDRWGNDYHRETFIQPYLDKPRTVYAVAMTEANAGIDAHLPYDVPGAGPMLAAVPDGDEIVLNGAKCNISGSHVADVIIVFARTDTTVGLTQGMTAFVVTKDTPGFSVAETFDLVGHRVSPIAEIHFDDCRIPKENQLTPWNGAFAEMARQTVGRHWVGARYLGVGRAAYELALEQVKTRVQGGKPIIEHQMVARQIGDMAMTLEVARNVIWRAAWGSQNPEQADPNVMRMSRVYGSEAAMKVALEAMRLFGARGIRTDSGMEKLVRDAMTGLPPAPLDVSLMVAGQSIAGLR
ncbi:acyl-CoA dehydrogenase family protein [Nocardioides sp.]|uniref:acyl-CoA dehydrogenase family protein n=1 Tax=Nocardioides sp. TaxID=35761 RepID=UPI003D14B1E0